MEELAGAERDRVGDHLLLQLRIAETAAAAVGDPLVAAAVGVAAAIGAEAHALRRLRKTRRNVDDGEATATGSVGARAAIAASIDNGVADQHLDVVVMARRIEVEARKVADRIGVADLPERRQAHLVVGDAVVFEGVSTLEAFGTQGDVTFVPAICSRRSCGSVERAA
ncbi:MAG: hypothetical protein Q8O67_29780 [Deltaproteobacteria bacterium]|nr:hypothetical protein [Deltaproteobacteria bacterium]